MSQLQDNLNEILRQKNAYLTANNIRQGITVLGVEGNLAPDKPDQTKNCTPSTSAQVITPDTGYELSQVNVSAVTASIDANIVAGNIKKDVAILGVTGTYEGSGGTSPYNMFSFSTVAEMNACQDMETDDLAEVYSTSTSYLAAQNSYNFANVQVAQSFTVTDDEMSQYSNVDMYGEGNNYYFSFNFPDQGYGQGEISISNGVTMETQSFTYTKNYESGTTTCTLSNDDYNTLKSALASMGTISVSQIDGQNIVNKVFSLVTLNFGLYKYNGTNWVLQSMGFNATSNDIVSGKKVYTDTGVVTGALIPTTKANWMHNLYNLDVSDPQAGDYFTRLIQYGYNGGTLPSWTQYYNNWDMISLKRVKPFTSTPVMAISAVNNTYVDVAVGYSSTDAVSLLDNFTGNLYVVDKSKFYNQNKIPIYDYQTKLTYNIDKTYSSYMSGTSMHTMVFNDYVLVFGQHDSNSSDVCIWKLGSTPWQAAKIITTPSITHNPYVMNDKLFITRGVYVDRVVDLDASTITYKNYDNINLDNIYWYDGGCFGKKGNDWKLCEYDETTDTFTVTTLDSSGLDKTSMPSSSDMAGSYRQDAGKIITPIGLIDIENKTFALPTIPNSGALAYTQYNMSYYTRPDKKGYLVGIKTANESGQGTEYNYNVAEITKNGVTPVFTLDSYGNYPYDSNNTYYFNGGPYYKVNLEDNVIECRSLPTFGSGSYGKNIQVSDIVGYANAMPTDIGAINCFWINGGQYGNSFAFTLGGYNVDDGLGMFKLPPLLSYITSGEVYKGKTVMGADEMVVTGTLEVNQTEVNTAVDTTENILGEPEIPDPVNEGPGEGGLEVDNGKED